MRVDSRKPHSTFAERTRRGGSTAFLGDGVGVVPASVADADGGGGCVMVEPTEGGGGGNTGRVVNEFVEGGRGPMEDSHVVGRVRCRVGLVRETGCPGSFIPGLKFSCDGAGRCSRSWPFFTGRRAGYVSKGTEIVRLPLQGWLLL